ncbi:MAG: putative bifunctional diguanylate cyclase/phosphodiesterase [Actinomycetes bacterium]
MSGIPERRSLSSSEVDRAVGLHNISRSVMQALAGRTVAGLDEAIDQTLAEVGKFCGVDRAYVFQFQPGGAFVDNTHEWCADGISPEIDNLQNMPRDLAQGWLDAFEESEHVFIEDVDAIPDEDAELREVLAAQSIRSLIVTPLRSGGELLGFMGFDYVTHRSQLSWVDVDVLVTIGETIAAAVGRRHDEGRVAHAECTDRLTGLLNRAAFAADVESVIAEVREARRPVPIVAVIVDLDGFTEINNAFGFALGDEVLIEVTARLRAATPDAAILGRFGSDAFSVLVVPEATEFALAEFTAGLEQAFAEPFVMAGRSVRITASIGAAVDRGAVRRAAELLAEAEAAEREAWRYGGARTVVFDAEVGARVAQRLQLTEVLNVAEAFEFLHLAYQPVVDLTTDRVVGAEALARWDAPMTGTVPPERLIRIAERIGVIDAVTEHIIATALRDTVERFAPADREFRIAINLSGAYLGKPDAAARVLAIAERSGVEPRHVCFEMTESAVVQNATVIEGLRTLRAAGFALEIDDFGTGYSSFARLRDLPFTGIKVDRSFVAGIEGDPAAQALVAAQADVAASLGLSVLAEGIETDAERETLVALEIGLGQGYGLHRPMPADRLAEILTTPGA